MIKYEILPKIRGNVNIWFNNSNRILLWKLFDKFKLLVYRLILLYPRLFKTELESIVL